MRGVVLETRPASLLVRELGDDALDARPAAGRTSARALVAGDREGDAGGGGRHGSRGRACLPCSTATFAARGPWPAHAYKLYVAVRAGVGGIAAAATGSRPRRRRTSTRRSCPMLSVEDAGRAPRDACSRSRPTRRSAAALGLKRCRSRCVRRRRRPRSSRRQPRERAGWDSSFARGECAARAIAAACAAPRHARSSSRAGRRLCRPSGAARRRRSRGRSRTARRRRQVAERARRRRLRSDRLRRRGRCRAARARPRAR